MNQILLSPVTFLNYLVSLPQHTREYITKHKYTIFFNTLDYLKYLCSRSHSLYILHLFYFPLPRRITFVVQEGRFTLLLSVSLPHLRAGSGNHMSALGHSIFSCFLAPAPSPVCWGRQTGDKIRVSSLSDNSVVCCWWQLLLWITQAIRASLCLKSKHLSSLAASPGSLVI